MYVIFDLFRTLALAPNGTELEWAGESATMGKFIAMTKEVPVMYYHQIASQPSQRPDLQLQALHTLDLWPVFPIFVLFSPTSQLPIDRDSVTAALQLHDRVCEISVQAKSSPFDSVPQEMQGHFLLLERLDLKSQWYYETLISTFLGGSITPCLRTPYLDGIAFPSLTRLHSSASDLVVLRLHRVPKTLYLSPEALVSALSVTARLNKRLYLHFARSTSSSDRGMWMPLPSTRVIFSLLFDLTPDFDISVPQSRGIAEIPDGG
jgi:hypothetical protein